MSTQTVHIVNRANHADVASSLDVTGYSPRNFDKLWDGLVMKVDFEKWMPVYEPPMLEDESQAEWLARTR